MTVLPPNVRFPTDRLPGRTCPACGADGLRAFYAVSGVPVQSSVMVETAAEAAAFPTGDIELAMCATCGLVTNVAFDAPHLTTLSIGDRPLDLAARRLAERWAENFGLRGKTVVEIGCGQGGFLEMLCQIAGARGVGFDPLVRRDRSDTADALFVAGEYQDFAAEVKADLVFCRNTLSDIAEPSQFLSALSERLAATPAAFEVSDTQRVLADGAFWDFGHAPRHYFTKESLTRVFQRSGFEVTRSDIDAGRLSVTVDAEPFGGQKRDMPALTELRLAAQFVRVCTARMREWLTFADDARRHGHTCVIWGSGPAAVGFVTTLGVADIFAGVIDARLDAHSLYLPGTPLRIVPPAMLPSLQPDVVVVMDPSDRDNVEVTLSAMGLTPRVLCFTDRVTQGFDLMASQSIA